MSDKPDRPEIDAEKASKIKDFINLARGNQNKVDRIEPVPDYVVQKASLISAHFLLPSNAIVVDAGCGNGQVTYAMALLNPLRNFIGIDNDRKLIESARALYKLPNLTFQHSDARLPEIPDDSLDGIINSNILHEIYSAHNRDPDALSELLEAQIKKLKPGGIMLIRDYMMPPGDEYVLLELPDVESISRDIDELSYADLLIEYSQTARPMEDGGYEGFYLEELDPGILKTLNPALKKVGAYEMTDKDKERLGEDFTFDKDNSRVFRLLHKWAVEFIHRKDERSKWHSNLDREYTFFTERDYRRELARFGMRFVFAAPHRNPWVVDHFYKGKFRLYTEDARLMPPPATNYFIVAQKVAGQQSLVLDERRPSQKQAEELEIITMRDKKTGMIQEMVRRPGEYCDVIPYRFTADGRLVMYVRSGYPRPIINAVKRGNANLDSKSWSGHLIEPITMDTFEMGDDPRDNKQKIIDYLRRHASLDIRNPDDIYVGLTFYPAPDRIDEEIEPVFVEVKKPPQTSWEIGEDGKMSGFRFGGTIMELDANDILRAAQVGLLPEPRLELHAFDLMRRSGIEPPAWVTGKITVENFRKFDEIDENELPKGFHPAGLLDIEQVLDEWEHSGFSEEKGGHHLKTMRSVFVEEGKSGGAMRGMASKDYEFIVTEDGVENIAVVYPLTRGWDDNLMMGVEVKNLPVPQRTGGSGAMLTAPSFVIPRDVRTIEDAKIFIGRQFGVGPDRVWQLGESYFTHTGVTPQRLYPFVVAAEGRPDSGPEWKYTTIKRIAYLIYGFNMASAELVKGIARIQMALDADHGMAPDRTLEAARQKTFDLNTEKIQIQHPAARHAPLSRLLGERDSMGQAKPATPKQKQDATDAVSLRKKPTQKLSLNFNYDEDQERKKQEQEITLSSESNASEALNTATKDIAKTIPAKDKPKAAKKDQPVLRATRPDPNL